MELDAYLYSENIHVMGGIGSPDIEVGHTELHAVRSVEHTDETVLPSAAREVR